MSSVERASPEIEEGARVSEAQAVEVHGALRVKKEPAPLECLIVLW